MDLYRSNKPRPQPLKKKFRIGSIEAPLNYQFDTAVFHINDIPADKLKAKRQVEESLKSKILTNEKQPWSVQTKTGENVCHRRTYVNSTLTRSNMYVYNYRAEKLPDCYPLMRPRANKFNTGILEVQLSMVDQGTAWDPRIAKGISRQIEELPNHPDLRNKALWNISSDIQSPIHNNLFSLREIKRVANSANKKATVKSYSSPSQLFTQDMKMKRITKAANLGRELQTDFDLQAEIEHLVPLKTYATSNQSGQEEPPVQSQPSMPITS